ncbi:flagellar basal body rod protein [Metabacillus sp. GX 13764]|uniref:lmo0954 family membrane protein n=1 Tax=Metabacillus kandeliae TaxID=2900151 RepID=UPI001E457200|nr:flagellar basal body rod protein [Metabacillus kandeliae]MCD7033645.1 flagellar basal body rod protein [Metabacillus kandeliae]
MKKAGLVLLGITGAVLLLANAGHMIGMAISLVLMYFAVRGFLRANSGGKKVLWGALVLVALLSAAANIPALLGVAALCLLYFVMKSWKTEKKENVTKKQDPFTSFEKQWEELKRK